MILDKPYTYKEFQRDLMDPAIEFDEIWKRCDGKWPEKEQVPELAKNPGKPTFVYPNSPIQGEKAKFPEGFEGTIETQHGWILLFRVEGGVYRWGHIINGQSVLSQDAKDYYVLLLSGKWPRPVFNGPFREGLYVRSTMCGSIGIVKDAKPDYTCIWYPQPGVADRKSTRLNSSHSDRSRMPSSA